MRYIEISKHLLALLLAYSSSYSSLYSLSYSAAHLLTPYFLLSLPCQFTFVNYVSRLISCIICLRFYNHLICYIYLSFYLFIFFMFSELYNVDVLFRLSGPPRIALLTAGHPGLFISICKK